MADFPADYSVSVQEFTDPNEIRPKDDQAIVLNLINKEIPNKTYAEELNKHVKNDNSFLYIARITRDRLCVVLDSAALASKLVDEVGFIEINNTKISINFLVAKAVKVIISNAGYVVSNSALKKFLVNVCKIRTASSVSELKANMDPTSTEFRNTKSFRRVVYIHPEDVPKLPKKPVKFTTPGITFNVFFDADKPKCFTCGSSEHLKISCPKNHNEEKSYSQISSTPHEKAEASASSIANPNVNNNKVSEVRLAAATLNNNKPTSASASVHAHASEQQIDFSLVPERFLKQNISSAATVAPNSTCESSNNSKLVSDFFKAPVSKVVKRPLSTTSSEISISDGAIVNNENTENSDNPSDFKVFHSTKKRCSGKNRSREDFITKTGTLLEPARALIEVWEVKSKLNYDQFTNLIVEVLSANKVDRRKVLLSHTHATSELYELLGQVHSQVVGKGIKSKITSVKKVITSDDGTGISTCSDYSSFSENELPDDNDNDNDL